MTCDAIVEGVHFLPDDPLDTVAQKALGVNLSDLAAKGAKPDGVLISLIWPNHRPVAEMAGFATGLKRGIDQYRFALLGGDMTATRGPLVISVTAFGALAGDRAPARADAKFGQDLWVTGTIGDAVLGLKARRNKVSGPAGDIAYLVERYQRPQPRVAFAKTIGQMAGASMDVSDGLIADARKMAAASGVRLVIDPAAVPLSEPAARLMGGDLAALLTGGDDYEILFTAEPGLRRGLRDAASAIGLRLTLIGAAEPGEGVACVLPDGRDLGQEAGGFVHRLGG